MINRTYMHSSNNTFSITPPKFRNILFPHHTVLKFFMHPSAGDKKQCESVNLKATEDMLATSNTSNY